MAPLGQGPADDVAWSPDGETLAVTSPGGVYLYETQTWKLIDSIPSWTISEGPFDELAFSPDGSYLILNISYNEPLGDYYWQYDIQSKKATLWFENEIFRPKSAPVFSPDGKTFALLPDNYQQMNDDGVSSSSYLEIRDTESGELLIKIQQQSSDRYYLINSIIFSPDGSQLATASDDHFARVWDITSGNLLYQFPHDSYVTAVSFSPDGRVLASAGEDAAVRFWDLQTGESLYTLRGFTHGIEYVTYLENGVSLLVGHLPDNVFREYALDERYLLTGTPDILSEFGEESDNNPYYLAAHTRLVHISPDFSNLAVLDGNTVQIWDLETGSPTLTLPGYSGYIHHLAFSPTGETLALADQDIQLWDISSLEWKATLPVDATEISDMVFHPDGQQIAFVNDNGNFQVWNAITQQIVFDNKDEVTTDYFQDYSFQIAYSPDGSSLAKAGLGSVSIWDTETGRLLQKNEVDWNHPLELSYTSNGSELIYIDRERLWKWDVSTSSPLCSIDLSGYHAYSSWQVALSQNLVLVMDDDTGQLAYFDPATCQHLYDLPYDSESRSFVLHPDGHLLAFSVSSGLQLVGAISRKAMGTIDSVTGNFAQFSPDGKYLVTNSSDGITHFWDISLVAQYAADTDLVAATPIPTKLPTQTAIPEKVEQLEISPVDPPVLASDAIRPGNIDQIEKLTELGFGTAEDAAWSPNGKTLAVGSYSGVYTFKYGETNPSHFFSTDPYYPTPIFSTDGALLAAKTYDKFQVWDIRSEKSLDSLESFDCFDHEMIFSRNENTYSIKCKYDVSAWDPSTEKYLSNGDYNVDISPDGRLAVVTGGYDSASLIKLSNGEINDTFYEPGMFPYDAKFSPDGRTLAIVYYKEVVVDDKYQQQRYVQLWSIRASQTPELSTTLSTGKFERDYSVKNSYRDLIFSPDSRRIFMGDGDGQLQIWDANSGVLQETMPVGTKISLSPDGTRLVSLGNQVQIRDVTAGRSPEIVWEIPGFITQPDQLMFTGDGQQLASTSNGIYRFWMMDADEFTGQTSVITTNGITTYAMQISPDGKLLAYSAQSELVLGKNNPQDPDWQTLKKYPDQNYGISSAPLVFSPDSSLLAAEDPENKVLLWRLDKPGSQPMELGSDLYIIKLLFSPDGTYLLGSGYQDSAASYFLWDTQTGKLLRTWEAGNTIHNSLEVLPDGVTVVVLNDKGDVYLYDLRTWSLLRILVENKYANDISVNPDGSLLIIQDNRNAEIWEVSSGSLLKKIGGDFYEVAFSPDGKFLALSSADGKIQIWGLPGSGN